MQINFIWGIGITLLSILIYMFYAQYRERKTHLFREISKRSEWIEPVLETPQSEIAEEHILEEIIEPILPRKKTKSRQARATTLNHDYDALALYVMAPNNSPFQGYDLLQAISVNGFHYGKMQIFHYPENPNEPNGPALFSLANAIEPGFFNLDEMGACSCAGLILFMRLERGKNLSDRFYLMLDVARQLADDLGAQVLDEKRNLFDVASEKAYLERLQS